MNKVAVQPDGGLLAAGTFSSVAGLLGLSITRLRDQNVLTIRSRVLRTAQLEAWPIPAHSALTVSLDVSARPRTVLLLNLLGQTVLQRPAGQPLVTLGLQSLPTGQYILCVEYASGCVTRHISVE